MCGPCSASREHSIPRASREHSEQRSPQEPFQAPAAAANHAPRASVCVRCRLSLDPDCPHVGPDCCACAEMEVRQLFAMLEDEWPDRGEVGFLGRTGTPTGLVLEGRDHRGSEDEEDDQE